MPGKENIEQRPPLVWDVASSGTRSCTLKHGENVDAAEGRPHPGTVGFLLQSEDSGPPGSHTSLFVDAAPQLEPQPPGLPSPSWASSDQLHPGASSSGRSEEGIVKEKTKRKPLSARLGSLVHMGKRESQNSEVSWAGKE